MRRAAALSGLSATALAGLTGCSASHFVVRAAERLHGCVDVRVPRADGVHVQHSVLLSEYVRGPVTYALVVPDRVRPAGVVYLLPGRGGTTSAALGVGWDGFLAEHLRRGGRPFALMIVDSGESYFHPRASGENRLALVTRDLALLARDAFGKKLPEALMGQSMGGYGALLAAEQNPRRYRAVAVAGPAIFPSYDDEHRSVGDAFDSAADYARHDVIAHARALRGVPVRIAIGRRDPFLPGVQMFARALPTAHVTVEAGCHDDGFWRTSALSLLSFVGGYF